MAEEVQQNLLPDRSPFLDNFEISGTSIYCDETGGDYYDYLFLPGNKLVSPSPTFADTASARRCS